MTDGDFPVFEPDDTLVIEGAVYEVRNVDPGRERPRAYYVEARGSDAYIRLEPRYEKGEWCMIRTEVFDLDEVEVVT